MLSIPSEDNYIAARPSVVERAAFESSLGLFLALNVAPNGWGSFFTIAFGIALVVAFVPPVVRSMRGAEIIWPVTKRPVELRVTGPGKEPLRGVMLGSWIIVSAAAIALIGLVVWIIQRDSYGLFLVSAALWIVGSIIQVTTVYRAESAHISSL